MHERAPKTMHAGLAPAAGRTRPVRKPPGMSAEALRAIGPDSIRPSRDSWRAAVAGSAGPVPHRPAMERAFGRDFSGVRAYVGRGGALDGLGANAATDGARVVFAAQSPSPRQVAHELAHVVQMRGAVADGNRLSAPGSSAEREADRIAGRAARGERVSVGEAAPAALHRDIKADNLDVPHGHFKIDMTKQEVAGGKSGEQGTISYKPKATAPNSDSIRLTQIVEDRVMSSAPAPQWKDFEWKNTDTPRLDKMKTKSGDRVHTTIKGQTLGSISMQHFGTEDQASTIRADNEPVIKSAASAAMTDVKAPLPAGLALKIANAEQAGFFVDHPPKLPDAAVRTAPADAVVTQDYIRPDPGYAGGSNKHGKKKDKTIVDASIYDFPGIPGATRFRWDFETVARSDDIGLYYGTLSWHFEVDSTGAAPKVNNEGYSVKPGISDTFRAAVVEFNRYYANPHTVMKGQTLFEISRLYFGTPDRVDDIVKANPTMLANRDTPLTIGWRLRIPDVTDTLAKP